MAEEFVPVALLPLFDADKLGRVKELTVSNLVAVAGDGVTFTPCPACPQYLTLKVDSAIKYNDTTAEFLSTSSEEALPMKVVVDKGNIKVHRVPGEDPAVVYSACAAATCSQTKVKGMNIDALKAQARQLGFTNTGRRAISIAAVSRWRAQQRRKVRRSMRYRGEIKEEHEHKKGEVEILSVTCSKTENKKTGKETIKAKAKFCRIKTKDCNPDNDDR